MPNPSDPSYPAWYKMWYEQQYGQPTAPQPPPAKQARLEIGAPPPPPPGPPPTPPASTTNRPFWQAPPSPPRESPPTAAAEPPLISGRVAKKGAVIYTTPRPPTPERPPMKEMPFDLPEPTPTTLMGAPPPPPPPEKGKLRWQHDGDTWVYTDEDLSTKNKKATVKPEESLKVEYQFPPAAPAPSLEDVSHENMRRNNRGGPGEPWRKERDPNKPKVKNIGIWQLFVVYVYFAVCKGIVLHDVFPLFLEITSRCAGGSLCCVPFANVYVFI